MMLTDVLPMSNGLQLESGGEYSIFASNTSGNLQLAAGKNLEINAPQGGTPVAGMSNFTSTNTENNLNNLNWIGDSMSSAIVYSGDTIRLTSDSCSWINIDKFASMGGSVSITISTTGESVPTTQVKSYVSIDNKKMCAPLSLTAPNTPSTPLHLVICFVKNGKLYASVSDAITPTSGGAYTMNVAEITPAALKAKLNTLP